MQIYKYMILISLFSATVFLPLTLAANDTEGETSGAQLSLDDLRTFTDVFNQVRSNYVEETDDHKLMNAAIRGMLSELDPHSAYMESDDYRQVDSYFWN